MHGASQLVGTLDIAGVGCGLACSDPEFSDLLVERYDGFLDDGPAELRIEIDIAHPSPAGHEGLDAYARVGGDAGHITVDGIDFHGVFDETAQRGHIVQPREPAALEALLTAVYAARLLREGGCLLHAAAIVRDGAAYVFYGPSGSGKTTVSDLIGTGVISDEIAVIRPADTGWTVSGVPWRGSRTTAPLGAFCRLRQSLETRFEPLSSARAVRSLLACAFFTRVDAHETQAFLDTTAAMLARVPIWDMQFRRDREFWAALPRAAAA